MIGAGSAGIALVAWAVVGLTGILLAGLLPLALHRLVLLYRVVRGRGQMEGSAAARGPSPHGPAAAFHGSALPPGASPLPRVTVQLPIFNEMEVVEPLVRACLALDYPPDLLEIQILDDSTDATGARVKDLLAQLPEDGGGPRVHHLPRPHREGFKAGALAHGLAQARGDFLLILDADFRPHPDLLRRLLPAFADPTVGVVQARWDHLNEGAGLLTRCQAILLDGHFAFEQGGRHAAGRFLNFNGTAGIWRRAALEAAGGWSADTLTEDLDLSYRAQMAGWKIVYRGDVGVPAELPEGVRALEVQQQRWAQGGIQTARKLLPTLWRGPWPVGIKVDGSIHLLGHLAHPMTVILGVLLLPSAVARQTLGLGRWLFLDFGVFVLASGSFLLFYLAAARTRGRSWTRAIPTAALTMALGIGLTATVSRAVMRGLLPGLGGDRDPFHRTPKGGARGLSRYGSPRALRDRMAKLGLAMWMAVSVVLALALQLHPTLPLLLLFLLGWGWVGLGELQEERRHALS
jgi:cellulose synthase/poly-beta-1,6-N-acetylglucosamine synthase-like glycosyltransferase